MTETVSGQSQSADENRRGRPKAAGLTIGRIFTTPGVHPYDQLSWERRDVVQQNWKTGETVFEQRGVEFPDFWSVNASTIVTTKYFRGAVGTDSREWSLRQLVDRVVKTYRRAGEEYGYFATTDDAEVFEHELVWMLVHQVFSFNSPVWFNVGTPSPQQVSACFILAVDDSMDSILNWYREEGLIFKGGSGSGINLSRIRSSKELLSSGGTASGPVSFMRGADASAGTIKSGGATRRAAKMVVLDVDHPDVEEFIETKAREEDKIRALRDAGFDMDLGGKDIVSVQYQNANNSIRVSDEFMQAVEHGDPFGLRARLTGEVVETVDAKGLFRKMAQAAWECADPGIQYDSTINDWHTNPETGRITASNPCFTGDTLVHTDKGLIRFDELIGRANLGEELQVWTHDATSVDERATRVVLTTPEAYMITGFNHVVRLRFANGMELTCTPGHRIWTENRGYVEAENLTAEDRILALDVPTPAVNADDELPVAALVDAHALGERHDEMNLPTTWSVELAHYLGWLIGDGSTSSTVSTIYGSAEDRVEIMPLHQNLIEAINGGRGLKVSEQFNGTAQLRLTRGAFRRFLEGLGVTGARSSDKLVPASIYQAPPQFVAAFLQGLFDADGTVVLNKKSGSYVSLGSTSIELLRGTQRLLSTLGIGSRIYKTNNARKDGYKHTRPDGTVVTYARRTSYQLRISSGNVEGFAAHVNFRLSRKAGILSEILVTRNPYEGDVTTRLVDRIDEGVKLTYNLSEPRNHSYVANGIVVRNCSEYLSLDNSSCNLASLNLMKFLRDDDTFDADLFRRCVELIITAMDISISFADFPTTAITETTRAYRQLGIGYANLGALLMATGHGYDSDGGRSLAAAITSLMTGAAYTRSAELAGVVGPYDGYARNEAAHKRVMRKHTTANGNLRTLHDLDQPIHLLATEVWQECLAIGERNGWRNAQASLLAPTGTIGLALDCDTTGIEPDLALVKFKKLVGGSSMQIVNQTVPRALRRLGYQEEQIEAIVEHIAEHGNVIEAPGLRREHYEVFDCAMGARSISPMGHVTMIAAVQPYLSGAVSKTVNMPESATVEEIEQIYFEGWKLGLKALAIYRDNCKVGQPLSVSKRSTATAEAEPEREVVVEYRPTRRRLPKSRPSRTTSFTVGGAEGYMTAGSYPDDGLGEVFLKLGKQGSTLAGVMDAFSIAISIALQYGVPLETYVQKFTNMRFEPSGMTDDPDVRMAQSVVDYIFRRLALDYLPFESRSAYGVYTAAERARQLDTGEYAPIEDDVDVEALRQSAPVENPPSEAPAAEVDEEDVIEATAKPVPAQAHTSTELLELLQGTSTDAPLCVTCGTKMRPAGSCYVCEGCGSTSGCS
jgi:ribonucleoside-diphosphate reductase alpha chain